MQILLALGASLSFGVADLAGGLASRRVSAVRVVALSHVTGMAVALGVALVEGSPMTDAVGLGWGAAAGVAGGAGLAVLYHAIATTRVAVAAPAATLFGALVPILFGVAIGERPSGLAWTGIALALPAVGLISIVRSDDAKGSAARSLGLGIVAGVGFGLFGILISRTADADGMWPLVAARGASILLMAGVALVATRGIGVGGTAARYSLVTGVLDMAANVLFLAAARRGPLALAAIVTSMAPAWTIGLARFALGERIRRIQLAGLGLAAGALVLIGLG
ncbi:MAG TPA: DMT family transporter [Acidimicrobiia bacterium]|nr:DMT family transporter [Acidimicrobiia bacterium]